MLQPPYIERLVLFSENMINQVQQVSKEPVKQTQLSLPVPLAQLGYFTLD